MASQRYKAIVQMIIPLRWRKTGSRNTGKAAAGKPDRPAPFSQSFRLEDDQNVSPTISSLFDQSAFALSGSIA